MIISISINNNFHLLHQMDANLLQTAFVRAFVMFNIINLITIFSFQFKFQLNQQTFDTFRQPLSLRTHSAAFSWHCEIQLASCFSTSLGWFFFTLLWLIIVYVEMLFYRHFVASLYYKIIEQIFGITSSYIILHIRHFYFMWEIHLSVCQFLSSFDHHIGRK